MELQDKQLNDFMGSLKWKELSTVEEIVGVPLDEWETTHKKSRIAFAMQYVMAVRNKPELTIEEAENMGLNELVALAQPGQLPKANQS